MGISSALSWWGEWQLRILALSSLGVQFFLAIFAGSRRFRIPPWYRVFIWLSYLGSDALAIYALAMLFSRQKRQQYSSAHVNRDLEVFWAPILLMHLGGQLIITAYNIEDNELWKRHVVIALSQVTVAIYVFCKSWSLSSDRRLLAAAIFLFISGIAKCFEKPLSLMRSSFNRLSRYLQPARRTITRDREEELEEYVQEVRTSFQRDYLPSPLSYEKRVDFAIRIILDFATPYSGRLHRLKAFFAPEDKSAYERVKGRLSRIFTLLYTRSGVLSRDSTLQRCSFSMTTILGIAMPIVAIGLFHSSHKQAYSDNDVIITFVLVYGTLMLELISLITVINFFREWPDTVAQHSLIWFFSHNKRHTKLMSFARWFGCKDLLDQYWCMKSCYSSEDITNLVLVYVKHWWTKCITDSESYMMFNDVRGQWTLKQETCDRDLGWSLEKPFDESILLWHMATDFCFHLIGTSSGHKCANQCREMSNYMMHLLFANPEMLMSGSNSNLVTAAYEELEGILKDEDTLAMKGNFAEIVNRVKSSQDLKEGSEESFIHDAWVLAEGLMDLGDEKMWKVIEGVWVEMLCFSASRCRGYLHAKSLGTGVEYLSYVWGLLEFAGMETISERLQRKRKLLLSKNKRNGGENVTAPFTPCGNEPSMEEEKDVGPWASQSKETRKEEETIASPSSSSDKSTIPELQIVVSP